MNLQELEEREKSLEEKIQRIEKIEKELVIRLSVVENKLKIPIKTSKKKYRLIEALRKGKIEIKKKIPDVGTKRGDILKKQVKDILKKEPVEETDERDELRKRIQETEKERKEILRREIKRIIENKRDRKEGNEQKETREAIDAGKLKIGMNNDARQLFKILLKKGVMKTNEAAKELNVSGEKVNEWVKDLEKMDVIEVIKYPYGAADIKLKEMNVEVNEKEIKENS